MSWDKYIKKYVWDDNKTPYFVAVRRLNRSQADHELFAYTLFITLLFAAISIISLTENAPHGKSYAVAFYTFSVSCSAVLFGVTKHVQAAYYLALAPVASLAYFFVVGFPPRLATIDELVLVCIALALLRYSMRVVAIAKTYQDMPADAPNG
jgi:hypothetical protein